MAWKRTRVQKIREVIRVCMTTQISEPQIGRALLCRYRAPRSSLPRLASYRHPSVRGRDALPGELGAPAAH